MLISVFLLVTGEPISLASVKDKMKYYDGNKLIDTRWLLYEQKEKEIILNAMCVKGLIVIICPSVKFIENHRHKVTLNKKTKVIFYIQNVVQTITFFLLSIFFSPFL